MDNEVQSTNHAFPGKSVDVDIEENRNSISNANNTRSANQGTNVPKKKRTVLRNMYVLFS
jgi:hypothetical protein